MSSNEFHFVVGLVAWSLVPALLAGCSTHASTWDKVYKVPVSGSSVVVQLRFRSKSKYNNDFHRQISIVNGSGGQVSCDLPGSGVSSAQVTLWHFKDQGNEFIVAIDGEDGAAVETGTLKKYRACIVSDVMFLGVYDSDDDVMFTEYTNAGEVYGVTFGTGEAKRLSDLTDINSGACLGKFRPSDRR